VQAGSSVKTLRALRNNMRRSSGSCRLSVKLLQARLPERLPVICATAGQSICSARDVHRVTSPRPAGAVSSATAVMLEQANPEIPAVRVNRWREKKRVPVSDRPC